MITMIDFRVSGYMSDGGDADCSYWDGRLDRVIK